MANQRGGEAMSQLRLTTRVFFMARF